MTHGALHVSAIALGVAAFVSISPLSTASADSSTPSGATPSLSEPAPTPSVATSPPSGTTPTQSGGDALAQRADAHAKPRDVPA
jgi:hypothetical protein